MKTIVIIILLLSLIDLTSTYFYVREFNLKFPKLDYTTLEANPILRFSWKTLGMNKGMIVGGIIVFTLLFLIASNLKENYQFFLLGTLTMMCIYHILNFSQLARLAPAP